MSRECGLADNAAHPLRRVRWRKGGLRSRWSGSRPVPAVSPQRGTWYSARAMSASVASSGGLPGPSVAASCLPQTPREEPYGTVALARLAVSTFQGGGQIIVLCNHGYVARGEDLSHATDAVVQMHLRLLEPAGRPPR